jgi:hypothetical protein
VRKGRAIRLFFRSKGGRKAERMIWIQLVVLTPEPKNTSPNTTTSILCVSINPSIATDLT